MRSQGDHVVRMGVEENVAGAGQPVEAGGFDRAVAGEAEGVAAQGVDRDEHHVAHLRLAFLASGEGEGPGGRPRTGLTSGAFFRILVFSSRRRASAISAR